MGFGWLVGVMVGRRVWKYTWVEYLAVNSSEPKRAVLLLAGRTTRDWMSTAGVRLCCDKDEEVLVYDSKDCALALE